MKTIKRYFIIFLSIIILVFNISVFAYKPVQVKAAVAVVPAVAEVGSILWGLLMTAVVGIGAYEVYDNYKLQEDIYKEYLSKVKSGDIVIPEGGIIIDGEEWGSGVLNPDSILILDKIMGWNPVNGGEKPPDPDEEPPKRDEDYWQKWGKQNSFKVNGAFLGTIADFIAGIYEDTDSELYKELFGTDLPVYTGQQDNNIADFKAVGISNYEKHGGIYASYGKYQQVTTLYASKRNLKLITGIISTNKDRVEFYSFSDKSPYYHYFLSAIYDSVSTFENGYVDTYSTKDSYAMNCNSNLYCNVPVFSNFADAKNFIITGDDSQCLNKVDPSLKNDIDFAQTVPNLSTTLSPLVLPQTGTQTQPELSTQNLVDILLQIKTQIDTLKQTETQINTETHTNMVTNTITEVITKTETETKPDIEKPVYPGVDTGTTGEGLTKDWKLVFPFCIPFDLIDLVRTFDAEPKPLYFKIPLNIELIDFHYVFEIDLSMFDDVAKLFRLCETILFIAGLMFVTGKVIKW